MVRGRLLLLAAPVLLAAGAWIGTSHNVVLAYNTPQCSISEISGSATDGPGGTDSITFQVLDLHGNAFNGQTVDFTTSGSAAGSVAPTSGSTNNSGDVTTVFTASAADTNGQTASIVANDPVEGCAGGATVTITGGTLGISTGNGSGSGSLPNTSTGAPGPNGVLYLGLGLALMVILGGAVTLRRSRAAAS